MKREEKNQMTRQKILESAMREFARGGYDGASMNNLCALGGVSKGIVYHYFADKDALYLACVGECFSLLARATGALELEEAMAVGDGLKAYFDAREAFFAANPECRQLFCLAASHPPEHLREQVSQARQELDGASLRILTRLLRGAKLREGIRVEEVAAEFRAYQDYFNLRARTFSPEERERACRLWVDILLNGVIAHENA